MNREIENVPLCSPKQCTGCMACVNSCKHQAIVIVTDEKGFYRPSVVIDKCVSCGVCSNVCPVLSSDSLFNPIISTYACWNIDAQIRRNSSSGGLFFTIAQYVIRSGGIVYGVKLNQEMEAVVSSTDLEEGISSFMGSKYIQCHIDYHTFRDVKKSLDSGRYVLYSGTSCQIAGLRKFLKKDYVNLLTVDFLCHGVPSPVLFKKYIEWQENLHQKKIVDFRFRDKKKSWHLFNMLIKFDDGTCCKIYRNDDYYYQLFLKSFTLQDSCFNCLFARYERVSDITMADYWVNLNKIKDDDKGISVAIINTEKGQICFEQCKEKMRYQLLNKEKVIEKYSYLNHPSFQPDTYHCFWEDYKRISLLDLFLKYVKVKWSIGDFLLIYTSIKYDSFIYKLINKLYYYLK